MLRAAAHLGFVLLTATWLAEKQYGADEMLLADASVS